jgi:2'-5' RNA ligase
MRLFFALWPPDDVRAALAAWATQCAAASGGRAICADRLHLTLAFVGEVTPQVAGELVSLTREEAVAPSMLTLTRTGTFGRGGIVWAGPGDAQADGGTTLLAAQRRLARRLDDAAVPWRRGAFTPHVTLVRRAQVNAIPAGAIQTVQTERSVRWMWDRIALVVSEPSAHGVIYRVLVESPCAGAVPPAQRTA